MAPEVHMEEAGDVIVLSSNNYLGLSDLPEVIEAGKKGLDKYGAGTASVRFICGTLDIHRTLEDRIAEFLGTEASLSYVACWNANTGLFATVCGEGSAIVSDELNHASIIDGVRLGEQIEARRLQARRHGRSRGETASGAGPLADSRRDRRRVFDGRLAREAAGDRRAVQALRRGQRGRRFARNRRYGQDGRGTIEHFGLTGQVDIITGTLGKALGGAAGGFVAGSHALIDILIQRSRPQLFSNALPGTVACSSLAAIDYLDAHPELVDRLRENTAYFRAGLTRLGFKPLDGPSAIVPIIVGETSFAIAMSAKLLQRGIFVTGFGFPVVPEGTARIRTQLSAALTKDEMDRALAAFEAVGKDVGLL